MLDFKLNIVKFTVNSHNYIVDHTTWMGFPNLNHLQDFHVNLNLNQSMYKCMHYLMWVFTIFTGAIMPYIIKFIGTLIDAFNHFINSLIKKCSSYYDPVKDSYVEKRNPEASSNKKDKNLSRKRKYNNSDSDGEEPEENNSKKKSSKDKDINNILTRLIHIFTYIRGQIINARNRNIGYNPRWYGDSSSTRVTLRQILIYALSNPNEYCPQAQTQLSFILSNRALNSLRSGTSVNAILTSNNRSYLSIENLFVYYDELDSIYSVSDWRFVDISLEFINGIYTHFSS